MRWILILFAVTAVFAIGFILGLSSGNITGFAVFNAEEKAANDKSLENELPTFRLYTKAVCDDVSNFVVCRDELFANCGGLEYILPKNEVNGNGVFGKDWKDPRDS